MGAKEICFRDISVNPPLFEELKWALRDVLRRHVDESPSLQRQQLGYVNMYFGR